MTRKFYGQAQEIYNPAAYNAAIARNIKNNARKTRSKKWLAVEGNQRLHDWLLQLGEFADTTTCSAHSYEEHLENYTWNDDGSVSSEYIYCDSCRTVHHPLVKGMFSGEFGKVLCQMQEALMEYGGLTDKQTELVHNALARAEKWEAERQAKYHAQKEADIANSAWIGTVGQRQVFTLTCERVISYDTDYGPTYINVCKDAEGHTVVYKGSNGWNKGEAYSVKATIKEHNERDGVKQTMIQRPTMLK